MLSRNIPIRFDVGTVSEIDSVARKIGITRSAVIKMAVRIQMDQLLDGVIRFASARDLEPRGKDSKR